MTQGAAAVGGLMLLLQLPAVAQTNIWKKVRQPIKNMEMKQALLMEKKRFHRKLLKKNYLCSEKWLLFGAAASWFYWVAGGPDSTFWFWPTINKVCRDSHSWLPMNVIMWMSVGRYNCGAYTYEQLFLLDTRQSGVLIAYFQQLHWYDFFQKFNDVQIIKGRISAAAPCPMIANSALIVNDQWLRTFLSFMCCNMKNCISEKKNALL